jgi:DNA-binding response OmpR family regulator
MKMSRVAPPPACFHGLVAHAAPYRVNHRGRRLELTPVQAALLYKLVRDGEVGFYDGLEEGSPKTLQAHIYALRRAIPQGYFIRSDYGRGYYLVVGERENDKAVKPPN